MLKTHVQNLMLLKQFTRRDIKARYQGTVLGLGWLFIMPILLLTVFTFVFNGIFQMKWPSSGAETPVGFALFVFCGLMVHQTFAETLTRAPSVFLAQTNLITKVVFPLWVLPASMALSTIYHMILTLIIFLLALLFFSTPYLTWLIVPFLLVPFLIASIGVALLISSLGVYLRDLGQMMGVLVTVLMFLSPVFYPLSSLSGAALSWLKLNPLAVLIESLRSALLLNEWPSAMDHIYLWAFAAIVLSLGSLSYYKLKRGFADVL